MLYNRPGQSIQFVILLVANVLIQLKIMKICMSHYWLNFQTSHLLVVKFAAVSKFGRLKLALV